MSRKTLYCKHCVDKASFHSRASDTRLGRHNSPQHRQINIKKNRTKIFSLQYRGKDVETS